MTTRPTYLPQWAVNDVNLPSTGQINKVRPREILRLVGWDAGQDPTAEEFNYQLNNIGNWIGYIDGGFLKVENNLSEITSSGDAASARTNLGLGTASTRNVGTGVDQIPDMNSFSYTTSGSGAIVRLPGGIVIQQGQLTTDSNGFYQVNMGVAMSTYQVIASEGLSGGWTADGGVFSFLTVYGTQIVNSTQFNVRSASWRSSDKNFIAQSTICNYVAIGRI